MPSKPRVRKPFFTTEVIKVVYQVGTWPKTSSGDGVIDRGFLVYMKDTNDKDMWWHLACVVPVKPGNSASRLVTTALVMVYCTKMPNLLKRLSRFYQRCAKYDEYKGVAPFVKPGT